MIEQAKRDYLDGNISLKDLLNGQYKELSVEDKEELICWNGDVERLKVSKNGKIVSKYTASELTKMVKRYAKEDGCVHFILEEPDGVISQTCDVWLDCDIEEYIAENNMKILAVIDPDQ